MIILCLNDHALDWARVQNIKMADKDQMRLH